MTYEIPSLNTNRTPQTTHPFLYSTMMVNNRETGVCTINWNFTSLKSRHFIPTLIECSNNTLVMDFFLHVSDLQKIKKDKGDSKFYLSLLTL